MWRELLRYALACGVCWLFIRAAVAWAQEKPDQTKLAVGVITWMAGSVVYGLMIGGCN